jgi:hypothetical protein
MPPKKREILPERRAGINLKEGVLKGEVDAMVGMEINVVSDMSYLQTWIICLRFL